MCSLKMASLIFWFLLIKFVTANENYRGDSVLHHLNSGIKFAKEFLGSESVALKVADFVVRAFQTNPKNKRYPQPDNNYEEETIENDSEEKKPVYNINEVPYSTSPLRHLVRLLGLRPNQISAVAVNALIFVAQMITTFLAGPRLSSRPNRSDDHLPSWILNKRSQQLQELIAGAKNKSLPDQIEELIKEQSDEETNCIRLLVCKITPFIYKMQETVFSEKAQNVDKKLRGAAILYQNLPTSDDINVKSDVCERKYTECNLYE